MNNELVDSDLQGSYFRPNFPTKIYIFFPFPLKCRTLARIIIIFNMATVTLLCYRQFMKFLTVHTAPVRYIRSDR